MFSLTWLPDVLRKAGLKVVEQPGWQTTGHGDIGQVKMIICHHTGSAVGSNAPALGVVTKGRPGLQGPLCQLLLARDGTFYVVAAGKAWHAGTGSFSGITNANPCSIGIEAENTGVGEVWPDAQKQAYAKGCAALADHVGIKTEMIIGHKEWTKRKIDPSFDMVGFRTLVNTFRKGK